MKKIFVTPVLLLGVTLGALPAFAADTGSVYVGIEAGSTHLKGDGPAKDSVFVAGQKFKDSDTNYGVHLGYQFNEWFAAELSYSDYGSFEKTFSIRPDIAFIVSPNDTQVVDAKGTSLAGVFSYGLGASFSLLGVLGVSSIDYDTTWTGGFSPMTGSLKETHSFSDQGLLIGVGSRYKLNDSLSLRIDLRRSDVGDFNLDTANVGVEYGF